MSAPPANPGIAPMPPAGMLAEPSMHSSLGGVFVFGVFMFHGLAGLYKAYAVRQSAAVDQVLAKLYDCAGELRGFQVIVAHKICPK